MLLWSYLIYVLVAVGLTVWLASTLFTNGALFLEDVFDDRPEMARAMNRLLVVGFYMLNLGWAFLIIRADQPQDAAQAVEILAAKLGLLLFTLGIIHFANLYVFSRIRRSRQHQDLPPVQPTLQVNPYASGFSSPQPAYAGGPASMPNTHPAAQPYPSQPYSSQPYSNQPYPTGPEPAGPTPDGPAGPASWPHNSQPPR